MPPGQSHLISRCITVIVQTVGTVELQKLHLYSRAATQAGAGAGPRPARAHRGWHPCQKTGRARSGLRGADQPAQTACTSCRHRPCPSPHPGPACSLLVHAHCPHVCRLRALASADDPHAAVRTALFEALTAPGNLLQGKIKNQT